jgi:hypothetical protein
MHTWPKRTMLSLLYLPWNFQAFRFDTGRLLHAQQPAIHLSLFASVEVFTREVQLA